MVASTSQLAQLQLSKKAKKQAGMPKTNQVTDKVDTTQPVEQSKRREHVEEVKIRNEREYGDEANDTTVAEAKNYSSLEMSETAISFNVPRQKPIKKFTLQSQEPNQNQESEVLDDEWRSMLEDDWSDSCHIRLPSAYQTDPRSMRIREHPPNIAESVSSALSDQFATLSMEGFRSRRNEQPLYTVDLTTPPSENECSSRPRRTENRRPVAVIDLSVEEERNTRTIGGGRKEMVQREPSMVDLTLTEGVGANTMPMIDDDASVPVNVSRHSERSIRSLRDLISDDRVSSVSDSDGISVKNVRSENFRLVSDMQIGVRSWIAHR